MNPRQIFHTFLLINNIIFFIAILSLSIIGSINTPKEKFRVWICSKALTIKEIIKINMNNTFPLLGISSENEKILLNLNYYSLLKDSSKINCKLGYKKCGKLDSVQNLLCIKESSSCPINQNFFTSNSADNEIIAYMIESDESPKYISEDNFIFDNDIYNEEYKRFLVGEHKFGDGSYDGWDYGGGDYGGGGDWGGGDLGGGGGGIRLLEDDDDENERAFYKDYEMTDYIYDRFKEEKNIDKYYKKIDNELYVRNYIGFENNEDMEKFIEYDFRSDLKALFPNYPSLVIGYFCLPFLIGLIIFSMSRCKYVDRPYSNFEGDSCCVWFTRIFIIVIFLLFFLGYYIYIIYKYVSTKNNCKYWKNINADFLIKNFIDYYCKIKKIEKITLLTDLILFLIPTVFFIIGWIYNIYYNLYLKEDYKAKVLGLKNKNEEMKKDIEIKKNENGKMSINEKQENKININDIDKIKRSNKYNNNNEDKNTNNSSSKENFEEKNIIKPIKNNTN